MSAAEGLHVFRATGPSANIQVRELSHAHLEEQHEFPEGMFVTAGTIDVLVDGKPIAVSAGGMLIVPPHAVHTVMPASEGTLVIFN
jgi:mannose-6-phosphate isomerase-like protein (cupin superfamily)